MQRGAFKYRFGLAAITVLATLMLGGCELTRAGSDTQQPVETRPEQLIRVLTEPGDTAAELAERYGGRVLVWHGSPAAHGTGLATAAGTDSAAVQPFAIIGTARDGLDVNLTPCDSDGPSPAQACWERNSAEGAYLAGAQRLAAVPAGTDWRGLSRRADDTVAGGRSTIWNEGRSTIWNEGGFHAFPENTEVWQRLGLEMAHNPTFGDQRGEGITVAVIDTGVDLEHPYLKQNLTHPSTWLDLVDRDRQPQEEGDWSGSAASAAYGHGTVVAGIIRQVAPNAQILPIRALGSDGRGLVSDVVEAVNHAIESDADIINLSLGSPLRSEALSQVISLAGSRGIFVTMSAGNTGRDLTFPAGQAADPLVPGHRYRVAVTSVDAADLKSGFAAYGADVGLAAPGEGVWGPAPEERLAAWSGTSMAAPMAAGALALALAQADGRLGVERAQLADVLQRSGEPLYGAGRNVEYEQWSALGHSRLNVWNFLDAVLDAPAGN